MTKIKANNGVKKILLLGDSIRIQYQIYLKELLEDKAIVYGPDDNCRFAEYTRYCVIDWLEECGVPDIIHWNNGLWDIMRRFPYGGPFTPLPQYINTLRSILYILQETKAKIIWANSTPVLPDYPTRFNSDIDIYNRAASKLMVENEIEINDLNTLVKSNINEYIGDDFVHHTPEGSKACAKQIVECINIYL